MRLRSVTSYFAVCAVTLGTLVLACAAPNAWAQSPAASGAAKPPYNIIFVISDQEADHLLATGDFELPARAELRRRGVRLSQSLHGRGDVHAVARRVHQRHAASSQRRLRSDGNGLGPEPPY